MKKIFGLILMLLSFNAVAEGDKSLQDIQFKDINNNVVTLEKYKGKHLGVQFVWPD